MANRNKGRKGRSRKRRPAAAAASSTDAAQADSTAQASAVPQAGAARRTGSGAAPGGRGRAARRREQASANKRDSSGYRAPGSVGERPQAPWHPFPLDEIVILAGLVAVAVGFARREAGKTVLLVGVAAVLLGTLDTTVREHRSGYRSHAGLLASVPTALFHGAAALALYALGAPQLTWVLVPLALDAPLFYVLLKLLRARFQDARRERVFAGKR